LEQLHSEPQGEPDTRARAKELRQVVERQSRGTPAMRQKKKARGTCGDSLSPRFTGLKLFFYPPAGVSGFGKPTP